MTGKYESESSRMFKNLLGKAHNTLVFDRRVKVLINKIGSLVPGGGPVF